MTDDFNVLKIQTLFPVPLSQWWKQGSFWGHEDFLLLANTRPLKGIRPSPRTLVSLFQECPVVLKSLQSMELSRTSLEMEDRGKSTREVFEGHCKLWEKNPSKDLEADLEQSGVLVSTCTIRQAWLYGRRSRKTPLLKKRHKNDWSLPKSTWAKHNPSGKMFCGQAKQK